MNASKLNELEVVDDPSLVIIDTNGFYVSVGDVVAGKYLVEHVLGVGGMAFVLAARHIDLDERFALKFLNEQFLCDKAIIERFTHEAKAACRLRSEHVARVYDVGVHNGAPFLVMEYLEGRDLATLVAERGPLRIDQAVEYTMQACEALAVAHRHGIVHRDIKPENLFLVEHEGLPIIKLLDFGISKIALAGPAPMSRLTGQLTLGTPCYMSPEQIRSTASADARSDLWSLGVVLYELLAGMEAFRAPSVNEVCAAVLERDPEPLEEVRPDLPRELADVVARCLEKDPDRRFANVAELAMALLPFAPTRALVCAERSSSLMRTAQRATQANKHRISSVRPSGPARSSDASAHWTGDGGAPDSEAPLARALDPSASHAPLARPRGRRRGLGLLAGVILAGAALGVLLYPIRPKVAVEQEPAAAATPRPDVDELPTPGANGPAASVPIAVRALPADSEPTPSEPSVRAGVATSSAPKRAIAVNPSALPPRVRPGASSSSAASAQTPVEPGAPKGSSTTAPSAPPVVELGY